MKLAWARYLPTSLRDKLEGRQQLLKVIGNTGWLMGGQVVRQGVVFIIGILMARYFGPALFGEFNYALAFAALLAPLGLLGLDGIAIRELVRDPSCRDDLLGTSFALMLVSGSLVFGLALCAISLVRGADSVMLWLVGIMSAATIFQAFNAVEFWLESRLQWKFSVLAKSLAVLLGGLVKVGLIVKHASLVAFAWTGFVEAAAGAAGLVIAYRSQGLNLQAWRFNAQMARRLLKDSWPMMLSAFVTMVYLRIDQVMLGTMAASEEVGIYAAAVRLSESSGFISMAICASMLPVIAQAGSVDTEESKARIQRLYNLMALVAYSIAIPTTFLSGWLVQTLYGPAYSKAAPLLAVLVWCTLFTNLGAARTIYMISRNWTRANLVCLVAGGIINITLNLILIPRYGAMGAVIASFISYWFAVQGSCLFFKSLHNTGWMLTKAMIYPKAW
ncbi:MAG TPA: flippase [Geomonas sp.]